MSEHTTINLHCLPDFLLEGCVIAGEGRHFGEAGDRPLADGRGENCGSNFVRHREVSIGWVSAPMVIGAGEAVKAASPRYRIPSVPPLVWCPRAHTHLPMTDEVVGSSIAYRAFG